MRLLSILFILLLLSFHSFSKDKTVSEYRYSLSGFGFSQQKLTFLSPVFYNGYSLVSTNGKVQTTKDRINSFVTEFNMDYNSNKHDSYFYSMGFDLTYNKYYLLTIKDYPKSFPRLFIGWGYWLDSEIYLKPSNTNNPLYYNLNNMACFTFCCEQKYQKVKISCEFNFTFFGIYSGSEYSSGLPYFIYEKDAGFFQAFDIGSFGMNPQSSHKLNVDFKLNAKRGMRSVRFQYEINGTLFSLNNNVKHNTFHVFKIGYLFNTVDYEHK